MDTGLTITRKHAIIGLAAAVLIAFGLWWSWSAAEEKRRTEELATAQGIARVLTTSFAGKTDLRVAAVNGTIDVTSVNQGSVFNSSLRGTLPFSVDYFVDLSGLTPSDVRYDAGAKRLLVTVPDVTVADPRIDLARGEMDNAKGWWVSRAASQALVTRSMKMAGSQAEATANEPANLNRAREEGRQRIAKLLDVPLSAAGYDGMTVEVRYIGEGQSNDERWDVSRSIQEVLDEAAQQR
jgi:hypothetical protein